MPRRISDLQHPFLRLETGSFLLLIPHTTGLGHINRTVMFFLSLLSPELEYNFESVSSAFIVVQFT